MISESLYRLLSEASLSPATKLSGGEVLWEVNLSHPGLAVALYACNNKHNRTEIRNNSDRLRRVLDEGKWLFDGSPIRVNTEGILDDGQHRTREVSGADLPDGTLLRAIVLTGMKPEAFIVYDTGKPRSHGNTFDMAGIKNARQAAAAVKLLVAYYDEDWPASLHDGPDSNEEALANYRRLDINGALERALTRGKDVYELNSAAFTPRILSSAYYLLSAVNQDLTDTFFDQLAQKAAQAPQVAALVSTLASRYSSVNERVVSKKVKGSSDEAVISLALIFKAWNAWLEGKTVRQLKYGLRVESFPVPHDSE